MYHKIQHLKSEYELSEIARSTGHSLNTVKKYAEMDLSTAKEIFDKNIRKRHRKSQLDSISTFIEETVESRPKIKASKLLRKVKEHFPEITVKERAFRNYLRPIKEKYKDSVIRFFHTVYTSKEKSQVQVDLGEYNIEIPIFPFKQKVYFVAFVFSYSRKLYVSYQDRPYKTTDFIKAHLEAFRYFGGIAKEYVYDQTKLVVINEKYREVWFNKEFHQFALKNEFLPVVCEGYDPQSKGKVERAISYIKSDFLEGEVFESIEDLRTRSLDWLATVANCRIHRITGRRPDEMFEEEREYLKKEYYHFHTDSYVCVDKTGLISYKGNHYSVPYIYQRKKVAINVEGYKLYCYDIVTGKQIAEHVISLDRYQQIIDDSHYISTEEKLALTTEKVMSAFATASADITFVSDLVERIKEDNPHYARQQLIGLTRLVTEYPVFCWHDIENAVFSLPKVKVSAIERLLKISKYEVPLSDINDEPQSKEASTSTLDRSLDAYMKKIYERGGLRA
jgi:transposase